ncbi:MAG: hypothetical protein A2511_11250 [Deltaproteobacteria bacterium RIFOXYD12_FULL_50_9]|nr:MAG: hypothetical protein A2511_11250 [Deltaproteobacteria bacterium RIFOXYD12_FULL_50_9]
MKHEKQNILIVDDRPVNLMVLRDLLASDDLNIVEATTGNEALSLIFEYNFSLILLDVQMPEMDGFETAELLRGIERSRNIPIIFVTAISKEQKYIFKGYEVGAVDYLFKPLDPHILKSKVRVFLELDFQKRQLELTTNKLVSMLEELEASKAIIEEQNCTLRELAIKDGLTGIYNHRHFLELFAREISLVHRFGQQLVMHMMDLDHFKIVNDTHGHPFGDLVLKEFIGIVRSAIRESDIVGRYGGEEFELILTNTNLEGALRVAEKIRQSVQEHIFTDGTNSMPLTVSIGMAACTVNNPEDPDLLIKMADKALYEAKNSGRNRVVVFNPQ